MGAQTDAARAEVLASRQALLDEVQRLEASARAAVDIPSKVKRNPARTAGLAAGTAFIALGGPQRLYRRARRAVFGPDAELPKSMLPKDIEKTIRKMGTDGDKVRGTLEREFASYLNERSKTRRDRDAVEVATVVAANVLKPVSARLGKQLAARLFEPDQAGFDEAMAKVRARYSAQSDAAAEALASAPKGSSAPAPKGSSAPQGSSAASPKAGSPTSKPRP